MRNRFDPWHYVLQKKIQKKITKFLKQNRTRPSSILTLPFVEKGRGHVKGCMNENCISSPTNLPTKICIDQILYNIR